MPDNKPRVLMLPHLDDFKKEESGIRRVVEAYTKYLPNFGFEMADKKTDHDLLVSHAGSATNPDVVHLHGLYWTADYKANAWEWQVNGEIITALRQARQITVPSEWVAETIRRELRVNPTVIGHGIEWRIWQHNEPCAGYVLWNKNRIYDVCNADPVQALALKHPSTQFVSTFAPDNASRNIVATGVRDHATMRRYVQQAGVYLSSTKETFGIGVLEAMAAGVPILGYAWGGNLELVKHGVNGYLARPNDVDDLSEGLQYCLKHREMLGANGREMAKAFTWAAAVEKVAGVYRLALEPDLPGVTVVIPSYNYGDKVGRAIESALTQTYPAARVIVVDDGSPDDGLTERTVKAIAERDNRVIYFRQDNAGVANARNAGVSLANTKYICCLDADDAIEPEFLRACVEGLEADRGMGIAYTGLRWIKPDGTTGISAWPGGYDFDKQLKGQNQVPTCCVYRREMWKRLGGYRQRYAPGGAGEEDAEFWLRAGAYGYAARKVTDADLFVYSWMSGRVSGDKTHTQTPWLELHPWVKDNQHPFASAAAPANRHSHPVRQYDEPRISVIIPVGPGHERDVIEALDSIESQTFRRWELIVAWDTGGGVPDYYRNAYPYIKWIETGGKRGAGAARNMGAAAARAPFLVFLDADDSLYPDCLSRLLDAWAENESIIYTDYSGKAYVDDTTQLAPDLQKRIRARAGNIIITANRAIDFDCDRLQRQPESERMDENYIPCLITALVPRAWHVKVGGFDEAMDSWEDWDYWIRLARAGFCSVRLAEELVLYRFYTGNRRETGRREGKNLLQYMRRKYREEGKAVMCGCNQGKKVAALPMAHVVGATQAASAAAGDDDFVLIKYQSSRMGQAPVVGNATKTRYGYRQPGDMFLVHRDDIKMNPNGFIPVTVAQAPEPERAPLDAPQPVVIKTENSITKKSGARRKTAQG